MDLEKKVIGRIYELKVLEPYSAPVNFLENAVAQLPGVKRFRFREDGYIFGPNRWIEIKYRVIDEETIYFDFYYRGKKLESRYDILKPSDEDARHFSAIGYVGQTSFPFEIWSLN